MKLITWNVNGIRAVERKQEIQTLINQEAPDILFLQETKAQKEQLSSYLVNNINYHQEYYSAEKKGYSGVSVWLKKSFIQKKKYQFLVGMPNWNDTEGRIISFHIENIFFLGAYFPNGGKSPEAWEGKIKFYYSFLKYINELRSSGHHVIFCGDLNVAHQEKDLARPKENEGKIGFRKEERAWVDELIKNGWVDIFRNLYPDKISYTWWDMPTRARERNVGWRIDYFFIDKSLSKNVLDNYHLNSQMGSDHCPVVLKMCLDSILTF